MDYRFLWLRVKSYLFNKTLRIRRKFGYRTPIEIERERGYKLQEEISKLADGMSGILKVPPIAGNKFNRAADLFQQARINEEIDQIIKEYGHNVTPDQIYDFYYNHRKSMPYIDCNVKAERMIKYLEEIANGPR